MINGFYDGLLKNNNNYSIPYENIFTLSKDGSDTPSSNIVNAQLPNGETVELNVENFEFVFNPSVNSYYLIYRMGQKVYSFGLVRMYISGYSVIRSTSWDLNLIDNRPDVILREELGTYLCANLYLYSKKYQTLTN